MINNFPALSDHILVWIFGIIIPFLSGMQSDKLKGEIHFDTTSRRRLYLNNAFMLMISAGVIMISWAFHKRPFTQLGLNSNIHFTAAVIFIIGIFTAAYIVDLRISQWKRKQDDSNEEWFDQASFLPEQNNELPAYIVLCLAAGIFEEIIYRGFMTTYFLPDKQIDMAQFILRLSAPAALFSMAHYYQGWKAVMKIFIFSILLSLLYVQSGSLLINMILHFLVDLVSGLAFMKKKNSTF